MHPDTFRRVTRGIGHFWMEIPMLAPARPRRPALLGLPALLLMTQMAFAQQAAPPTTTVDTPPGGADRSHHHDARRHPRAHPGGASHRGDRPRAHRPRN